MNISDKKYLIILGFEMSQKYADFFIYTKNYLATESEFWNRNFRGFFHEQD